MQKMARDKVTSVMRMGLVAMAATALLMAGGVSQSAEKAAPAKGPKAIINTKFGEIEIEFFSDKAPNHVKSFIKLAKSGFYNGTIFHRVIPGFMIQGGDPNTKDPDRKDTYGTGGPGYNIHAEFNDIPHRRGILSAARSNDPNSAGSQFFIMVEDHPPGEKNWRQLDGQYTVFGKVVKGIGVADKIVNAPRDARDNPMQRIEMTVTIVE